MTITREQLQADRAALRVRWQRAGFFRGLTVSAALQEAITARPSTCFHFQTEKGYYKTDAASLNKQAHAVARGLAARGMKQGHVLAVQMPLVPEAVVLFLAAAHLGAVLLPIVHTYGPAELTAILEAGKAHAFATLDRWRGVDFAQRVAATTLPGTLDQLVVAGPGGGFSRPVLRLDTLMATEREDIVLNPGDPQDDNLLLFSSGTTGVPKGIRHSNESILAEYQIRFFANSGPYLNPMPAGHIAALLVIFQAFLRGIDQVSLDRWDPALAAELIERLHVTQTGGVPVMLMGLLEAAARDKRDLSSVRSYKLGGTGVTPRHVQMAEDAGFVAGRFYGLSEHPSVSIVDESSSLEQRAMTDGVLCEGTEVRIVDESGRDLPLGTDGEIATRGPELFVGYTDPALELEYFLPGGWFLTGDTGHLNTDGCITITDRKKDLIIRGGENISPKEIEGLLLDHPAIKDVAVVGYPEERMGERVCAAIVAHDNREVTLKDVTEHLRAKGIAKFKLPERVMLVNALPLTANGKVRKDAIRAQILAEVSPTER